MKLKVCCICLKHLEETKENFASRFDRKIPTFQSSCRECQRVYRKKHYLANKRKYIDKAKTHRNLVAKWFIEEKSKLKCKNCSESRYWVLDFHHKDKTTKEKSVGSITRSGSKQKLLKEMKKCEILCSNCHRDFHHKERIAGVA